MDAPFDYAVHGHDLQSVELTLPPGVGVVAEPGALLYADSGVEMQTGMQGGLLGAAKRVLGGEQLFVSRFENTGAAPASVGFAAPYPGQIVPVDLEGHGGRLICQRDCFLCGADDTRLEAALTRRFGAGLFGGQGFVLQRLVGGGRVFVHGGGAVLPRDLAAGEEIWLDAGCLVGMTDGVDYDIRLVGGVRNTLFGGEGLFRVRLAGPGRVYLQTMPFQRLVDRIQAVKPVRD